MKCHSVCAKKEGPSFKETAAKYKGKADAAGRAHQAPHHQSQDQGRRQGRAARRAQDQERSRNQERRRLHPVALRRGMTAGGTASASAAPTCSRVTLGAGVMLVALAVVLRHAHRRRLRPGVDQHRGVLHRLPRDARQRLRRVQGHDPRQEPLRRARDLRQLPRAARAGRADLAQDAGELRGLGPPHRQDRHQGEVREAPLRDGGERVDAHEEERLAGVPQLPPLRRDGAREADREGARAPRQGAGGGHALHRLPLRHRAQRARRARDRRS